MLVILALKGLRQDSEFETSLGYVAGAVCQKERERGEREGENYAM